MPAARHSSIAYWISGLSTTVSISFGIALVAGRNRVPRPATGNTALRIRFMDYLLMAGRHRRRRGSPLRAGQGPAWVGAINDPATLIVPDAEMAEFSGER